MRTEKLPGIEEIAWVLENLQPKFISQEEADESGMGIRIGGKYKFYRRDDQRTCRVVGILYAKYATGYEPPHTVRSVVCMEVKNGLDSVLLFKDPAEFKSIVEVGGSFVPKFSLIKEAKH